jgi:hypothetical protein
MCRDTHIQGVCQIAGDIAVLIIHFVAGLSTIAIVEQMVLAMLQKSFSRSRMLIGDLAFCTSHSLPDSTQTKSLRIPPALGSTPIAKFPLN